MAHLKDDYFVVEKWQQGRWTNGLSRAHDPFVCLFCKVECPSAEELKDHARSHPQYCDRSCFICGSKFSQPARQMKHVELVHKKLRPYRCSKCSKCYFASHDLLRHINREHRQLKYSCMECPYTSRGDCELRGHYLKIHKCRIKFKGILGPEIEFVLPMSQSVKTEPGNQKRERIVSRIKIKYETTSNSWPGGSLAEAVRKSDRLKTKKKFRRVAKKSTYQSPALYGRERTNSGIQGLDSDLQEKESALGSRVRIPRIKRKDKLVTGTLRNKELDENKELNRNKEFDEDTPVIISDSKDETEKGNVEHESRKSESFFLVRPKKKFKAKAKAPLVPVSAPCNKVSSPLAAASSYSVSRPSNGATSNHHASSCDATHNYNHPFSAVLGNLGTPKWAQKGIMDALQSVFKTRILSLTQNHQKKTRRI